MNTFHLTVSSPDGNKFDGPVYRLDVRGVEGELAVMAGHIPFITSVVNAPCARGLDEENKKSAVSDGGLLTVDTDRVIFLSGSFEFTD